MYFFKKQIKVSLFSNVKKKSHLQSISLSREASQGHKKISPKKDLLRLTGQKQLERGKE